MTVKPRTMIGEGDQWTTVPSPVGKFAVIGNEVELHFVHLPGSFDEAGLPAEQRGTPAAVREGVAQIEAYFAHRLTEFSVPVAPAGTEFQELVWANLALIGYGQTESYAQLAGRIGRPTACRAVGLANGRNPIPLILPCHRVIGANGSLTGYGGGLPLKLALLEHERSHVGTTGDVNRQSA
jgi:methylated-DNA-[protein]-cysteine S-methyltransferase